MEVHIVKNNQVLKDDLQSKVFAMAFSIAAEIERELISQRTKGALARRKAGAKPLRPKGNYSSKLDKYKKQIEEFRKKGVLIASVAKVLRVSYTILWNYLKRKGGQQ